MIGFVEGVGLRFLRVNIGAKISVVKSGNISQVSKALRVTFQDNFSVLKIANVAGVMQKIRYCATSRCVSAQFLMPFVPWT